MIIKRPTGQGKVQIWVDKDEVYIRESLDRGRDIQTVVLGADEFMKILEAWNAGKLL